MTRSSLGNGMQRNYSIAGVLIVWLIVSACALAQERELANPLRQGNLVTSQERLAEKYDRLELLAGRLAELSRATQPRRAKLLR